MEVVGLSCVPGMKSALLPNLPRRSHITRAVVGEPKVALRPEVLSKHPDAVRRREEAAARLLKKTEENKEMVAQLEGRSFIANPQNVEEIDTLSELTQKLSGVNDVQLITIVGFKAVWCTKCARLQYTVKKAAEANPTIHFLIVDITDRNGELFKHCVESGLKKIPYFWMYNNGTKVSEGKWADITLPQL